MSRLDKVVSGRIALPIRALIYGPEGTGKSSIGAASPNPIFLDIEGGSEHLTTNRYSFADGPGGFHPEKYTDVLAAIDDLTNSPHEFKTVVIDTVDRLEALMHAHICQTMSGVRSEAYNKNGRKIQGMEDFGYGKGYKLAVDEWRAFARRLDILRTKRGMNVLLLGHAVVKNYKNPEDADYDRFTLRIHDTSGAYLREWCDLTGFYSFEEYAVKDSPEARAKGSGSGRRMIRTERTPAADAKSRLPIAPKVYVDAADPWAPIGKAIADAQAQTPATLRAAITTELDRIKDAELATKVLPLVADEPDVAKLGRYLNELRRRAVKTE